MNAFRQFADWINPSEPPRALTQSIILEESNMPNLMRTSVKVIGGLLGIFLIWASFADVEEVAQASGQIVPSGYIQNVQHLEGGTVRELLVNEGDLVEKGQPLLKLDDTNANADLGQMTARQQALQSQASRLRRFAQVTVSGKELTVEEADILKSMEEARASQKMVLADQIAQKEKELAGITASRVSLDKNVVLMRAEYRINRQLAAKGSGSKLAAMTSERELNAMQGQLDAVKSQESQAQDAINEAKGRLQSLEADLKQDAMKSLGQTEAELAEVNKTLIKLESASSRTTIVSPVRGLVKGLSVHTLGAVVEPGKSLMEIVPVGEDLLVDALVAPKDIGNLKLGQDVKIKVSAYDFARYGSIPGALQYISASTFQNEQGQAFYKVKVKLMRNYVGRDPAHNLVLPGMTVQADIVTGEKTILQYLLKPIHSAAQTAFHER